MVMTIARVRPESVPMSRMNERSDLEALNGNTLEIAPTEAYPVPKSVQRDSLNDPSQAHRRAVGDTARALQSRKERFRDLLSPGFRAQSLVAGARCQPDEIRARPPVEGAGPIADVDESRPRSRPSDPRADAETEATAALEDRGDHVQRRAGLHRHHFDEIRRARTGVSVEVPAARAASKPKHREGRRLPAHLPAAART